MSLNDDIFDIGDLGFDEDQKEQEAKIKDENPEKQKYINDNIIAKGYNLEDLSINYSSYRSHNKRNIFRYIEKRSRIL